jgi:hypothetical protein
MPGGIVRESVATRVVEWMSGVVDIMREPSPSLAVRPVLALLARTFDHTAVSWNWSDPDGSFGMVMEPVDALSAERDTLAAWLSGELLDCHALTAWFAATRDPAPYTLARVPSAIVPQRRRVMVERPLKRLGMHQQLSIVYRMGHGTNYAFVTARGSQTSTRTT